VKVYDQSAWRLSDVHDFKELFGAVTDLSAAKFFVLLLIGRQMGIPGITANCAMGQGVPLLPWISDLGLGHSDFSAP
jgi:hypothetical protein